MKIANSRISVFLLAVILLLSACSSPASQKETEVTTAETTVPVETTVPATSETTAPPETTTWATTAAATVAATVTVNGFDPADYTAPPFVPEVYDPADTREFRLLGQPSFCEGEGDSRFAFMYGECPIGVTITAKTDKGSWDTVSWQGCFAARFAAPDATCSVEFTMSYNGQQIGEPQKYEGNIIYSKYMTDNQWRAIVGYNNQGFFEKFLPFFQNTNVMSDSKVKQLTDKFTKRVDQLSTIGDGGCELIALLVPCSITIYPEIVPEYYQKGEGIGYFDQAVDLLTEAGVTVIDVRDAFRAHKNDSLPLYYHNDSHWSEYGAYIAYVELFKYISEAFPDAAPRKFDEFNWDWGYYTGGDMPLYTGVDYNARGVLVFERSVKRTMNFDIPDSIKQIFRGKFTLSDSLGFSSYGQYIKDKRTISTGNTELPNVYVFRNSYGCNIYDLIAERCNNATFNTMFNYTYNIKQITQANPNYVIYVLSEWDFGNLLDK